MIFQNLLAKAVWRCCLAALLWPGAALAQPADSFRLSLTLPLSARFATVDNLGNLYTVSTANAVEKYASDGRLLARYTNNRLGAAHRVDVSNPLKVLVWFADFRTVVFLDRSLTPLGELRLMEAGYPDVRTVAAAADGNLWLYDETAFRLRKITPDGVQLFESQELNLFFSERLSIACLRDDGVRTVAADTTQGLLLFDVYGQFSKILPLPGVEDFQLTGDEISYCRAGVLLQQSLVGLAPARARSLPVEARAPGNRVWWSAGLLLVQSGGKLLVFTF